ncbi:MAG: tRNA lysidine(34) synthetase TilS [Bacteroidetes bacterium]|nr:MAG: tRNA lysidine(34) synthetase TilS [Bacteroidota bacterium]
MCRGFESLPRYFIPLDSFLKGFSLFCYYMPKETLLHHFLRNLHRRKLLENGDNIIVAVSGGIDSVVLLHLLHLASKELSFQMAVAHVNHNLRGQESGEDESFVRTLAERYRLTFHAHHAETLLLAAETKKSIQEAAREIRYNYFSELRRSLGFNKIAVAHNANDNAETILFNVMRGTGVKGLAGIPETRPDSGIVRPLLFATREQIVQFANEERLDYREDSSNKKTDYSRNYLRHNIVPLLSESINSNLIETLNRNAEIFTLLGSYLNEQAQTLAKSLIKESTPSHMILDRELFVSQSGFMQYFILYYLTKEVTSLEVSFDTIKEMAAVSHAETGAWSSPGGQTRLYRDRNHLVLATQPEPEQFQLPVSLYNEIQYDSFVFTTRQAKTPEFTNNRYVEYIDSGRLGNSLSLRSWKQGDWFIPLGMAEKKKLSDFFIEQKVPLFQKHSVPLFTSNDSIVWVCGKRLDERYKVTPSTTSILKLEYHPVHE